MPALLLRQEVQVQELVAVVMWTWRQWQQLHHRNAKGVRQSWTLSNAKRALIWLIAALASITQGASGKITFADGSHATILRFGLASSTLMLQMQQQQQPF
jgi:hypothetical protein